MSLYQKVKDLFDVPKLHSRIEDLERQLKDRPVINRDNFYDVAKPIDINGIDGKIKDQVISEFKPFLERHAIECLKAAFREDQRSKLTQAIAAYDVANQSVVVKVDMPRLETRFSVYSPRF